MNEKSELINPQKAYFNGKFKEKLQKAPGVQAEMEQKPDCGEDSYQGCNRLAGRKALVTQVLKELIDAGNQYDAVIAIGPMIMMKFVCETTRPYGIKTIVSMNTIMVDGTGMCGGCRLTVGGETKFACVDGPDFDGHKVDWDESLKRGKMYFDWERHKHEEVCNLFKKEVQ